MFRVQFEALPYLTIRNAIKVSNNKKKLSILETITKFFLTSRNLPVLQEHNKVLIVSCMHQYYHSSA